MTSTQPRQTLRVLATNDDGVDSPLFPPLVDFLARQSWCAPLSYVAPAEEFSWIAQAATPKRPVFVSPHELGEVAGFICSGTPADCVSLGIENLFAKRANLVVSGINIGSNAGLAYYLSSGTVGAARQAFISGVRAVALSVRTPGDLFSAWGRHDLEYLAQFNHEWNRVAEVAVSVLTRLLELDALQGVDLISVNLPWQATLETEAVITELQRSRYLPLFVERAPQEFIHRPAGLQEIEPDESDADRLPPDLQVLAQGLISITPIFYQLRPNDPDYLARLTEGFKNKS